MSGEEGPGGEAVEMVPNVRKQLLETAADRADTAVDAVNPSGGNPASSTGTTLSTAWVSAPTADDFITDLTGIGTSLRTAFEDAAEHLRSLADAQPDEVPADDPRARATPQPRVPMF